MAEKHGKDKRKSEPEDFVEFAERIPGWCVVIGLIGVGQEIHVGEEGGLGQWRDAIANSEKSNEWIVHAPELVRTIFNDGQIPFHVSESLSLNQSLRHHGAILLHEWVAGLVDGHPADGLRKTAATVAEGGMHLRITRDLETARDYLHARYGESPLARYGILTSSRDKSVASREIEIKHFRDRNWKGPWFADGDESEKSCRHLEIAISEFDCQGLELDGSLLIWGEDFLCKHGKWSNVNAKRYQNSRMIKDAFQLRKNAYRVLLTRSRDVTVVWVPDEERFNETYQRLMECGMLEIKK